MAGLMTWHELVTSDVDAATRFYTELLGVELETADMGDFQYPMLRKDGRTHAGFVPKPAETQAPSHWYPYIQADDVDATVEQAQDLGAQVYMGPAEVSERLRFAVLGDPHHATFGVMTWSEEPPTGVFAWDELYAEDVDAAKSFYGAIVGWTTSAAPFEGYQFFDSGETHVGGLMKKTDELPHSAWGTHFATKDVDASTAHAQELGAAVVVPPMPLENVGRFSVLTDPTGAAFGLFAES
jgi:uncharacterized protein